MFPALWLGLCPALRLTALALETNFNSFRQLEEKLGRILLTLLTPVQSTSLADSAQTIILYYHVSFNSLVPQTMSLVSNSSKYSLCFINHVLPHSYFSFFASALSISSLCWNKLQTNEIIFFVVNFIFYYSSKHWQFDLYVLSGWWW